VFVFLDYCSNIEKADNYSELIREIQTSLFDLQYRHNLDIKIFWVPGHADIPQNEMADYLAKVGARHASASTAVHSITMSEAQKAIKDITLCKWKKRWSLKRNNSAYKTKVPDPTISIMEDLINITPTMQKQIIRMRLDHTNLPIHKARFIHNTDTLCSTCQKQCDVQHVLVECSDYITTRQLLFDQLLFATSSKFNKLSIQNIDLESILGFDIRLNPKQRKAIFNSLSIYLRNSRVNA
jgi:hypothetical protein